MCMQVCFRYFLCAVALLLVGGEIKAQQVDIGPNLIRNSYMNLVGDDGAPLGFHVGPLPPSGSGSGVTITAVHPYTKGFEGQYSSTAPTGAATSVETATETSPYWFGAVYKGPRTVRGGLADGWSAYTDGKILKITGTNTTNYYSSVFFPFESNIQAKTVRFRAWVKIVAGALIGLGGDAGYNSNTWGNCTVTKALLAIAMIG